MKKMKYVAPQTKSSEVELEQGFMAGSVFREEKDTESLPIDNQTLGNEFNFTNGNEDNGNGWD